MMIRAAVVVGTLLLGVGAVSAQQDVAVQQQSLMRTMGRNLYVVISKMAKGDTPYDQAAADAAITELETAVGKTTAVFAPNPKEDVVNATFGSSQKIWQDKANFDSRVPPVLKAVTDAKGTIKDAASLKVAFDSINSKCGDCHETYRVKLK